MPSPDAASGNAFAPGWRAVLGRHQVATVVSGCLLLAGFLTGLLGLDRVGAGLYLVAMAVAAGDVVVETGRQLIRGRLGVDLLMLMAAAGAVWLGGFGEAAVLLFLFSLGHALEDLAMRRARSAIEALGSYAPETARRLRGDGDEEIVPVGRIERGDLLRVLATERIPIDGTIEVGESAVDQSPVTGESVPVGVSPGAEVFAGTLNVDGTIDLRATRLAGDTLMARMVKLVEEAEDRRGPTQRTADRFTRIYVPLVILAVALLILLPHQVGGEAWEISLTRGLTVLVGASPCALAISTPAAVVAGIARTARGGVLVKGGEAIEALGRVRSIAFDKTGTLTEGRPVVRETHVLPGVSETDLLGRAAAIERQSTHPLAVAIVEAAAGRSTLDGVDVKEVEVVPGRGQVGLVDDRRVLVGGRRLLMESSISIDRDLETAADRMSDDGLTVVWVAEGEAAVGVLGLADVERSTSRPVVERLHAMGIAPLLMLTGDRSGPAEVIASKVGIDRIHADLLPEDKIDLVRALVADGPGVAMVGDGVNDAPAMAASSVGIAMGGSGTDVALEAADVALMADDLTRLPFAISTARRTRRIITQNVLGSMGMVVLLILLGSIGAISLPVAVVLHEGSTVAVVLNALRLLGSDDLPVEVRP